MYRLLITPLPSIPEASKKSAAHLSVSGAHSLY
jgi:hypothetical protein